MEVKPKPSFVFIHNMKKITKMAPERKGGSIEWLHIFVIGLSQNDKEVSFTQTALCRSVQQIHQLSPYWDPYHTTDACLMLV